VSAGFAGPAVRADTPRDAHAVIPGFERFYSGPKADAVHGGRLLLGELSCTSCHHADATRESFVLRKPGPVLDGVGARVKRGFLRRFLADPQAVKPGTSMPSVLGTLPEQTRAEMIEDLVHFLASTGSLSQARPEKKLIAVGRDIYSRIGCVACHGPRDADARAGKLLPTSVNLGDLGAKYSLASLAAFLQDPHRSRPGGRMPALLSATDARAVANYLLQGLSPELTAPNVAYSYYEGNFEQLPDFDKLTPKVTGKASGFDLGVALRANDFAIKFEGYLRIDRDGVYRFRVISDDGSKLVIDGKEVVLNDGIHAPRSVSNSARLKRGTHKVVATIFNGPGGVELGIDIAGPGLARQPLAPLLLLTPQGNPVKATPKGGQQDDEAFPLDPARIAKGQRAYAALGCANCHSLSVGGKAATSKLEVPALGKLRPGTGCLSLAPGPGQPRYALSPVQRVALDAAVKSLAAAPAPRPAPAEVTTRTMTAFNCYACHERGKVGGIEVALSPYFTTTEREMGEEGRVPPALDGVGAKLTPAYLRKVLTQGAHDRPYMHTHMPGFGDAVLPLVGAFEASDTLPAVAKVAFKMSLPRVKADGRFMVGALQGTSTLGCIKCHTFAGKKAEGVQGIDMTLMTQRLRRDWFHQYVIDPQKFRPGTRMPSAWPGGVAQLEVQGGDTDRQVEAIWLYLSDGPRAQLPIGMKKGHIPLIPDKEAIIYRNFIQGAGPRAIAVGYPEKAHVAFDANNLRMAMLWQGAFIDAQRHWTDRGSGFEPPLGDNILHLPEGVAFAQLDGDNQPWPSKSGRELPGYKFVGYRLTRDQRPTFTYSCCGARVEDFPNAVAAQTTAPSIRRTLKLSAAAPRANLWFRAITASKIEPLGDGWFRIDAEWKLKIESEAAPRVRSAGGRQELLVPVRFRDGRAQIVEEFVW
jgi:cbb3-type cytochrome oxidase cytochrome c subunit